MCGIASHRRTKNSELFTYKKDIFRTQKRPDTVGSLYYSYPRGITNFKKDLHYNYMFKSRQPCIFEDFLSPDRYQEIMPQ